MQEAFAIDARMSVSVARCAPRFHCDHADGSISVKLTPLLDPGTVYLHGTLDEFAAFVQRLADVVGELTRKELAATAPADVVQWPAQSTHPMRDWKAILKGAVPSCTVFTPDVEDGV